MISLSPVVCLLLVLLAPSSTTGSHPSSAPSRDGGSLFEQLDQNQDGQLAAEEISASHQRLFARLLRTSDADQDGRLSRLEFEASLEPQQAEKPLVQKQGGQLPGADALVLLLAKMNANGDQQIDQAEVPERLRRLFDQIEQRVGGERDGTLNQRELAQAAGGLGRIAQRIANQLDLDIELELALLSDAQWQSVQNLLGRNGRGGADGSPLADPQRAAAFFDRADANSDGQLTLDELPEGLADRFEPLLKRADTNHDGQLSQAELLRWSAQRSKAKPKQSPSTPPSPGSNRAQKSKQGVARLLKQWDKNQDQKISRQEAPKKLAARFPQLDRDGNGQLDREELGPMAKKIQQRRASGQETSSPNDAMMDE
jgi:Ca2+-binding EF-hand superfamily protein